MALLQRFTRHHDEDAFAEIVRRYATVVYATCHRILGDRARAEEVSQETFFRLVRKPEAVTRSLGGWLHRAATQLAIDAVRRDAARRKREVKAARARSKQPVSRWEELSPLIDEALAELPEETRTLLVRHFLQGKSQASLAVEHLTSAATVSRRIKAGLETLRVRLRGKGVLVAAAALSGFLADRTAQAAPEALLTELGKMTLISGAGQGLIGAEAASVTTTAKTVTAALLLLLSAVAAALLLIGLFSMTGGDAAQPSSTPAADPAVPAEVAPPAPW